MGKESATNRLPGSYDEHDNVACFSEPPSAKSTPSPQTLKDLQSIKEMMKKPAHPEDISADIVAKACGDFLEKYEDLV